MKNLKLLRSIPLQALVFISAIISNSVSADVSTVRINEVFAGYNGDSSIQFVELLVPDGAGIWGKGENETTGRMLLSFENKAGEASGRYVFLENPPAAGKTVLVATQAFSELSGAPVPDFIMPKNVMPLSGRVCWKNNIDNANGIVTSNCVSYGDYTGVAGDEGVPVVGHLPILNSLSLSRNANYSVSSTELSNLDFQYKAPTPSNSLSNDEEMVNNTIGSGNHVFTALSSIEQGRNLFSLETFGGNGRTCQTCHIPPMFNLTPAHVVEKAHNDPLFISIEDKDVNTMLVSTAGSVTQYSQPGDLHGKITDENGVIGNILAGTGSRYLVISEQSLSGTVTDESGNSAIISSFSLGNLSGINPVNGESFGLEDQSGDKLKRSTASQFPDGRALILVNADGFDQPAVFRKSPNLLNLALTAPYGLSGEFETLADFTLNAVKQHYTLDLNRREDIDFRLPNEEELDALVSFQESITLQFPESNLPLPIDNVRTLSQRTGEAEFFAVGCGNCHHGLILGDHRPVVDSSIGADNFSFTGVANNSINQDDGLPAEPPSQSAGDSNREMNTPQLMGIRFTAPYFHDNSAATLEDAVLFYNSTEFKDSVVTMFEGEAGLLGIEEFQLGPDAVENILNFLRTLAIYPFFQTRFTEFEDATSSVTTSSVIIKNESDKPLALLDVKIGFGDHFSLSRNRPDLRSGRTFGFGGGVDCLGKSAFSISSDLSDKIIPAGEEREITINFDSSDKGVRVAEFSAIVHDGEEMWEQGTYLIGLNTADNDLNSEVYEGSTCNFEALSPPEVADTEPPVFFPITDIVIESAEPISSELLVSPIVVDTSGSVALTHDAPEVLEIGDTTITWTAKDEAGNESTASQLVSITAPVLPLFEFSSIEEIVVEATGVTSIIELPVPKIIGGIGDVTITNDALESFPVGQTTITWQAVDELKRTIFVEQNVVVNDTTAPQIDALDAVVVEATARLTAIDLEEPAAVDSVSDVVITNNAPITFPVGSTEVIWKATDNEGNYSSTTQTIIIKDSTPPEISPVADLNVEASSELTKVDLVTPVVVDKVSEVVVTHDAPQTFALGITEINWVASDAFGNESTIKQSIHVTDSTPPVIAELEDISVTLVENQLSTELTLPIPEVSDEVGIDSIQNNAPALFTVGQHNVIWEVTDTSGNKSTVTQKISVDRIEPVKQEPVIAEPVLQDEVEEQSNNTKTSFAAFNGLFLLMLVLGIWSGRVVRNRG